MVKVEGTLEKKNTNNNYVNYKKNELTKTLILGFSRVSTCINA